MDAQLFWREIQIQLSGILEGNLSFGNFKFWYCSFRWKLTHFLHIHNAWGFLLFSSLYLDRHRPSRENEAHIRNVWGFLNGYSFFGCVFKLCPSREKTLNTYTMLYRFLLLPSLYLDRSCPSREKKLNTYTMCVNFFFSVLSIFIDIAYR